MTSPVADDDAPFRLESPPGVLWSRPTLAGKFGVTVDQITRWSRAGRIPRPWIRNKFGEPFYAPEVMQPLIDRFREHGGL
jgi:hypothetical protein